MLVRLFNEHKYKKVDPFDTKVYRVSKYLPQGMKKTLQEKWKNDELFEDDYIIGPLYNNNEYQIGVTGGVKYKEMLNKAITRELGEEIGLVPISLRYLSKEKVTHDTNKTLVTYTLKYKNSTVILDHQHNLEINRSRDDRQKQVGCMVYGSLEEVQEFLSKDRIYVYKSDDNIKGIVAITVQDIVKYGKQGKFKG